jgi:Na+/H+ antiporter NhaC
MIGSAWATIALMFPIVVDLLTQLLHLAPNTELHTVPIIIPIIGATLSGCVFGTQLSLISDNPIMSAASTGANHLEHVKTMAWYIIPVGIACACAFLFVGYSIASLGLVTSALIAFVGGSVLSCVSLELAQYFFSNRS